jgi:Flp pilus assembly protein TadG
MRIPLLRRLTPSFLADRRGVAAVEFALILPFMAILYFGSIEVSLMISADRKVSQTASSLADLVARTDEIDTAQITDVFDAATALFEPYNAATAQMRVTSVVDSGGGVAKVAWSKARNAAVRNVGDTITLEPGVLPTGGSVIMAEVVYPYQSALGVFMPEGMTLHETFYLRPRNSPKVEWKN